MSYFKALLYVIIFNHNNFFAQCANHSEVEIEEILSSTTFELRRFDKAVISSVSKAFLLSGIKGYYFDDEKKFDKSVKSGRAIAIPAEKANKGLIQLFEKPSAFGYIGFGKGFAEQILTPVDDDGNQRIAFFMNFLVAHEIAHIAQFNGHLSDSSEKWRIKNQYLYPTKIKELNADFGAGVFFGGHFLHKLIDSTWTDSKKRREIEKRKKQIINSASRYVYLIGDTDVENFYNHHGTPKERLVQFTNGFEFAASLHPIKPDIIAYMKINWDDLVSRM